MTTNSNDNTSMKELIYKVFESNPFKSFNFKQISVALLINDKTGKEAIKASLNKLIKEKKINLFNRGNYRLNNDILENKIIQSTIEGVVDMKNTGKAYIITDDLEEDVFIAANNTGHALHGDRVKVHLFPMRKGRKTEGQIVEVIKRSRENYVGTISITGKFAFLIPDDSSIPVDFFISKDKMHGAKNGDKVVAKLTDWPDRSKNPFGSIVQILGRPGDNDVEMKSIIANYDFPLNFSEQAMRDAEKISGVISKEEVEKRGDFREVWTCTIDPADAKDFDDALSLKALNNGNWEVGVHIADVSHYVKPNGAIDAEAYQRGTSVYLVDRTYPMLPEKLSNNLCSLRPDEEKLCFSAVFELNNKAKILKQWFGHTIIKSNRRYNYEEVQQIIEGGEDDFKTEILTLNDLAKKLRSERMRKGSILFETQEVKFILDEKGKPIDTYIKEQKESNMLIEDFMLLANRKVAELIGKNVKNKNVKTFVYRVHDEPNVDKLKKFADFIVKLGYKMKLGSRQSVVNSFNTIFESVEGKGEATMVNTIAVRTMSKAIYSTQNIGHYGLAFDYYTHFTSPIRRYPDLIVHRLLGSYLSGSKSVNKDTYEEYCKHCSDMEKLAAEAERASIKYKQAEFLQDKIGQVFNGLVSGVSKYGIFIEVEGNKCEGLVSMKSLNDDYYYLDEDNYRVIGQYHKRTFTLGSKVKIKVKSVNLQKKQMDFELIA